MKKIDHDRIVALATMALMRAESSRNCAIGEKAANRADAIYYAKLAIFREAERVQRVSRAIMAAVLVSD